VVVWLNDAGIVEVEMEVAGFVLGVYLGRGRVRAFRGFWA
jgi:hypothetical protein